VEDRDLEQFLSEFQTTGVKLAGALNGMAEGRPYADPAFTVALLKRALGHLHRGLAGLVAIEPRGLLAEPLVAEARREIFEIREGILALMHELRGGR
jgi:hypothetical protein